MASASCDSDLVYEGHHIERAPDRTGADRNAIVFELRSLEAIEEVVEAEGRHAAGATSAGNDRHSKPIQPSTQGMRNIYQRSRDVQQLRLSAGEWKM